MSTEWIYDITPEDNELVRLIQKYSAGDVHDCNVAIGAIRGVYWARYRVKENPELQQNLDDCERFYDRHKLAARIFLAAKKTNESICMKEAYQVAKKIIQEEQEKNHNA